MTIEVNSTRVKVQYLLVQYLSWDVKGFCDELNFGQWRTVEYMKSKVNSDQLTYHLGAEAFLAPQYPDTFHYRTGTQPHSAEIGHKTANHTLNIIARM